MKKINLFNILFKFLIIIFIFGLISAYIDYQQVKKGEIPFLNISKYNEVKKIQTFRGVFHKIERKLLVSPNESLYDSSKTIFSIFTKTIEIKKVYKKEKIPFKLKFNEQNECQKSNLYYTNESINLYTYCIEEIQLEKDNKNYILSDYLTKNKAFINSLEEELTYTGLNNNIEIYSDINKLSANGFNFYKCPLNTNSKDYYITPKNVSLQNDFCINKANFIK